MLKDRTSVFAFSHFFAITRTH